MGQYDATDSDVGSGEQVWDGGLKGTRLFLGGTGLYVSFFLTGLESTIVSTSLVAITDDLRGFGRSSWIITSYLLTYADFLMIWSKAGDTWGVKPMLLTSLAIFTAFSGGCSGARTLSDLLVIFSLIRMVSKQHYAAVTGLSGVVFSLGLVLGPLFGGAIAEDGDWRWVFLLNVPAGAVSWVLIFFSMPPNFPASTDIQAPASEYSPFWSRQWSLLRRVDFLGAFLVLAASVFIVAALQEGNYDFGWDSSAVIVFFVLSGICVPLFLLWQYGSFTTGLSMTVSIVEIPQRFQVVNDSSPIGAGVKLLAFAVSVPAGMMFCSILTGRLPVPLVYVGIVGVIMQVIGFFLYSEIKAETHIWPGQFGYLVIAGLGTGLGVAVFYLMLPLVVAVKDQSIALGTGFQLRMLGGALGIAAATAILHSHTRSGLSSLLPADEVDAFSISTQLISTLTPEMQSRVREVYAQAYSMQMKMVGGFSAAQFLALALVWKRQNVRIVKR
ncbi:MFS general substrate transporter [Aspergillus neoniger CBS 115656]|uniref:MFS general substrate transporter n=1 Tax=Aspergillus neoniger (strain CBS 115656) TaxID=1448310 RepID=A0A318Y4E9_ASPNB|nr:MFS general substrate transporter [Aspergillus neoniger CBS 115656]PYH29136.1 MFS general substrate transporter [Aspergillus neoniger CBS 115656]